MAPPFDIQLPHGVHIFASLQVRKVWTTGKLAHVLHLLLDDPLDPQQFLRLQRRVEALHLKPVQLLVVQRAVLRGTG